MNCDVMKKSGVGRMLNFALLGVIASSTLTFAAKIAVPLILFSGQSNMVCLGAATNDLPVAADRTKSYDNIKIHNRSDNASSKWSTLKPGFGADAQHFGPELYFGKVLMDSMPTAKFAFIKDASSGTYLGKTDGWLPPSSGKTGKLYTNMMTHIDNALKEFKDAYDTSKYEPKWAGFVWLQGEFDGMDQTLANKYEENMTNLIKDIRTKTSTSNLPVIMAMIKPISSWQYAAKIRAANIAIKTKLTNCDTMDTKDLALSSDNVHYNAQSTAVIGSLCAQRWLAMKFLGTVPVIYQETRIRNNSVINNKQSSCVIYNLSGRQIGSSYYSVNNKSVSSSGIIYNSNSTSKENSITNIH
jgi:hypothetical protein